MEQINILVVDDEKEIADLVEIYLVSDGYKVFKANNAKEGLEILDQELCLTRAWRKSSISRYSTMTSTVPLLSLRQPS